MALQQAKSWFRHQAAPITIGIIASVIVFAFIWWFTGAKGMEQIVVAPNWTSRPWSVLTYPWAEMPFTTGFGLLGFFFLVMWTFWVGGTIERDLGPTKYVSLWVAMILLPGLFVGLIGPLLAKTFVVAGMWLPIAGMTIVWCTRNPNQQIMLYGIIPLKGLWLGWITLGTTIILSGFGNPLLGVISALHLHIAWAFAANKLPATYSRGSRSYSKVKATDSSFLKKSERMDKGYYDDVKKREKEREERERLRKLFESSLNDDSDNTGTGR